MKRLIFSTLIIISGYLIFKGYFVNPSTNVNESADQQPGIEMPESKPKPVSFITDPEGRKIAYSFVQSVPENIRLISNVASASDSGAVRDYYGCSSVVNAGFYTKERTHLGLFQSQTIIYGGRIQSTLVDGFVYTTGDNQLYISSTPPEKPGSFTLQTGPVVRYNDTLRPLRLITDEFARRVIAATSNIRTAYFIVLYDAENVFSGPLLKDVPDIIEKIATKESIQFTDAINLDGGSASVFITTDVALSELVPSGGFFCIK